jgi:hypothetical protein
MLTEAYEGELVSMTPCKRFILSASTDLRVGSHEIIVIKFEKSLNCIAEIKL